MTRREEYHILVAEDEAALRDTLKHVLHIEGHDVAVVEGGFDALLKIAEHKPDLLISDLRMPHMSGFELLSVVRRRWPEIPAIAISGEYHPQFLPPCVICDAFFKKGSYKPPQLLEKIAELLSSPHRAPLATGVLVPVWLPRGRDDYYIVTCINCLRSFPVRGTTDEENAEQHTSCIHCGTALKYFIEGRRT